MKKPVKKYAYGGGIQPSSSSSVGDMLGSLKGLSGGANAMAAGMGTPPMPGVMMVRPGLGGPNAATDRGRGLGAMGKGRGYGRMKPGMDRPGTGGPNPGMRQPLPMPPPGSAIRNMAPMAAQQVMPGGRAFKKGGMVGCDWSPKSSKTMRGAARKGK